MTQNYSGWQGYTNDLLPLVFMNLQSLQKEKRIFNSENILVFFTNKLAFGGQLWLYLPKKIYLLAKNKILEKKQLRQKAIINLNTLFYGKYRAIANKSVSEDQGGAATQCIFSK
jgi:hypothetical protein